MSIYLNDKKKNNNKMISDTGLVPDPKNRYGR